MTWEKLAKKTGYDYLQNVDLMQEYGAFGLWEWGTGRYSRVTGGIKKITPQVEVCVAEYEYEHTINLKNPSTQGMIRAVTLCILRSSVLELPHITVRTENVYRNRFRRTLGRNDISFPEDMEFSNLFEVQGSNTETHAVFNKQVRNYFRSRFNETGLRLEMVDNRMLYHFGELLNFSETRDMLIAAEEMLNIFGKQTAHLDLPSAECFKE